MNAKGTLFAHLGRHEVFMPEKTYPPMTVSELAADSLGIDSRQTA